MRPKPLAPANQNLPNQAGEMRAPEGDTWRARLQAVLHPVWPKLAQLPPKKRAQYLRELYPLTKPWDGGPSWQYRVWRDEIARLEGRKSPLWTRRDHLDPDQGELF